MDAREPEFPCSRCGACCRVANLVPIEMREGLIDPDAQGVCRHLQPDNSCGIYERRPRICRANRTKPDGLTMSEWHKVALTVCDIVHVKVYGTPRVPLVILDSRQPS